MWISRPSDRDPARRAVGGDRADPHPAPLSPAVQTGPGQRDEETTRGHRVAQEPAAFLGYGLISRDELFDPFAVAARAAGDRWLVDPQQIEHAADRGHRLRVDLERHAGPKRELMRMAQ